MVLGAARVVKRQVLVVCIQEHPDQVVVFYHYLRPYQQDLNQCPCAVILISGLC